LRRALGSDGRRRSGARGHVRVRRSVGVRLRTHPAGRHRSAVAAAGHRTGAAMKVLVVSGIWPPDVGGPASHAPDVAAFLRTRGHDVEVVTTADAPPADEPYPVRAVPRRHPVGVRHYRGAALVHHRAREVDVVYTTGM